MVHWIHFVFGSTAGIIISAAHKDRAFKFYIDLGANEHNKICTQDVPYWLKHQLSARYTDGPLLRQCYGYG